MGLLILLIPLLIYLLATITKKGKINHPDDYFTAFKQVGKTEFTSSSIAYGFQISTIYPFLFWGASLFLFVPFINAIFWGLGILLFYFSLNKVSKHLGSGKTLHGLIGEEYGESLRIITSLTTIIGFIGYMIAELWFGSRVLLSILPNDNWLYISVFIFIFFICLYLFRSGQISSIKTDQIQLLFTYIGVFGIIIYLLYVIINKGFLIEGALFWGLLILTLLSIVILLIRKGNFISKKSNSGKILNVIVVLFFVSIVSLSVFILINNSQQFGINNFINLEGFGIAGLLSLMILPLGWQFVDLTNWQRLLSVKTDESKFEIDKSIKKGLLNFGIESPFTWILFIVFGLLISISFPDWKFEDILIDFPQQLINSTFFFEQMLGYTFIISIISIMLSTIDSFIMGISFTFVYDINPSTKEKINGKKILDIASTNQILRKGRLFSFLIIIISVILFVFIDKNIKGGSDLFINLLLAFYSASLSFLPSILGILFFENRPKKNWVLASILFGTITGVGIGFYAVLVNPNYAWYPIIISVSLSSLIYLLGYLNLKRV